MDKVDMKKQVSTASAEFSTAEYREEIAVLKEKVAEMNIQLKGEKERADIVAFGKEKLLLVNKSLIKEIKDLRGQDVSHDYNCKLLEMRRVTERQKELAEIMFKKHVSQQSKAIKMKLLKKQSENTKIMPVESFENLKIEAIEKDSGMSIPDLNYSLVAQKVSRNDIKLGSEANISESAKNDDEISEMKKQYSLLQEKHAAANVTHSAILNGIQEYAAEEKKKDEMKLEALEIKAHFCENRYNAAKMHAKNMGNKIIQLKRKYATASEDRDQSKQELAKMKKIYAENDELKTAEFEEMIWRMNYDMTTMRERREEMKKIIANLTEDANAIRNELDEIKSQCLLKQGRIVELEDANLQASMEILEERRLKKDESLAKEECAKQIVKLIVEKSQLVLSNNKMMMKKNMLRIDNEKIKEDMKNQGRILEKAQENLRDLEEEKYVKRLNKKKGLKKLRFWK